MTRRRNKPDRPVFDSIRKPTAPPTRKIGDDKHDGKAYPAGRKSKYKKETDQNENLFQE